MSTLLTTLIVLLSLSITQALAAPIHGMKNPKRVPDQYIVVLKEHQDVPFVSRDLAKKHKSRVKKKFSKALNGFVINTPQRQLKKLADDPRIDFIEADSVIEISETQSQATWGLDRIDQRDIPLNGSYTYNVEADSVNVYIIDTGIRTTHHEFGGRATEAFTVINDGNGARDCHGHGTHVAGTVGSITYGVAKQAKLHSIRILDCEGFGYASGAIAGIDWVTANHAGLAVANMSLGGSGSMAMDRAIQTSVAAGVTYIVAAGNSNADACNDSPARIAEAITVGATSSNDARARYSNWGSCVDIFAPGSQIKSTWNANDAAVATISGTSMASPHVAGMAALYLASNPTASPARVQEAILAEATPGQLSNIGSSSPNLLAYSLFDNESDQDPVASCPVGSEVFQTNLSGTNDADFQPNGSYYYTGSTGIHRGQLIGPANANFDLYLWKWSGSNWNVVAQSRDPGADEIINYSGTSGYYSWSIQSYDGSGDYSFCLNKP